jgi:hypothetical protein
MGLRSRPGALDTVENALRGIGHVLSGGCGAGGYFDGWCHISLLKRKPFIPAGLRAATLSDREPNELPANLTPPTDYVWIGANPIM